MKPLKHQRLSVEETIIGMICRYPSLFPNRTAALHHIFIVLGCGYEWKQGEITRLDFGDEPNEISREEAERRAKVTGLERNPYPWCSMCNLAEMPANAKPEWRDAAEEIRRTLTEQGYSFVEK